MITASLESIVNGNGHEPVLEQLVENRVEQHLKSARVLGVGGDASLFRELSRCIEQSGATLERSADEATTLQALAHGGWDAILTVLDRDADIQLEWWEEVLPRLAVRPRMIAVAPAPSMSLALRATELGVSAVLPLPLERDQLRATLNRVLAAAAETPLPLLSVNAIAVGPYQIVSQSSAMVDVYRTIAHVAPSTATVLIQGDSGTGKELVARAIHAHGPRSARSFVAVNCAAIPENLLESELFGHEKGAFTGAVARKIGRFERASGGTLFLDEIGDMSLVLQSKILRAIQEREVERVGGGETIPVDVRVIAATNKDLKQMIAEGKFREDLYYRLAVVTIKLPQLVARGDDLLLLTSYFAQEFAKQYGKRVTAISDRAVALLRGHGWVGNVRELRNVIERAVLLCEGDVLRSVDLPDEWLAGAPRKELICAGPLATLQEAEARHISQVLSHTHGQIGEAAQILGVHRNTLARKIKEYHL
ncbi:MAG TPA: sigma-54 dependent transcriptional regulator [Gemmatimonadales bacterium]|nr:sigma-54 dependent transcriptional regulator [Gemmatimonadales bacterium]